MTPEAPDSGQPRVALVTGATGAIGKAIARQIAAHPGFEVVLACRDQAKAERAVREIVTATGNSKVRYELVDVSRGVGGRRPWPRAGRDRFTSW